MTQTTRVLVAEDDRVARDLLCEILRGEGYTVEAVDGGREALELLQAKPFDAVLLDVQMPGMDGFQVLEQLMSDSALRHTPVIMVSGFDEMASVVRCIAMGAADYLHKPFDPELLRARIDNSLEKKRLLEQEVSLRQELEANYRRLQELEQLRDSLTHMVVHDLRQPLHALGLMAAALSERSRDPGVTGLVAGINASVEALEELFNELLDMSKLDAGAVKPELRDFPVSRVLERLRLELAPEAAEKGLRLRAVRTRAWVRSTSVRLSRDFMS